MSLPHNFGAGLFPEDEDKKTRNTPAPDPEPVSDETPAPEYSRSDFDNPSNPTFTPAAFSPAEERRFDDLGLPQAAPAPPDDTTDTDIFGDVVPVDDAQDAKAAALRTQRRESVESRGVEPLDDRIHGAEIPTPRSFDDDRRGRRGGRGRRPREEGQEPRRDGRRGSRMDRPDRPDPRRRREESTGAPLSDSLMSRPMDLGRPDMGRPDMGRPDMGRPDMGRPIDADQDSMSRSRVVRPIPGPSYDRSFSTGMIEQSPTAGMYSNPLAANVYGSPQQAPLSGSGYGMPAQGSDVSGLRREIDDLKAQLNRSLMSGGPSASSAYGVESFSPRVVQAPPPVAPPVSVASFATIFGTQRVAVLADVPSLQRSAKKTFGRVVSFSKLLTNVLRGRGAVRAIAFLADRDANDPAFIQHLRQTGFEVRRTDMSAGGHHRAENGGTLALEASRLANRVDVIVFAGGDQELIALIPALRAQGCRVELASFPESASDPGREAADSYSPLTREDLI